MGMFFQTINRVDRALYFPYNKRKSCTSFASRIWVHDPLASWIMDLRYSVLEISEALQ